jgi:hypothetical protein
VRPETIAPETIHRISVTSQPQDAPARRWRTGLLIFVWALLGVGLSMAAWSLSTPFGEAPDEPAHMIQAAAVVRGQLDGPQVPVKFAQVPIGRVGAVTVPAWVTDIRDVTVPLCVASRGVPDFCDISPTLSSPRAGKDTGTVLAGTQFSNYPPLYYLIVGVPSVFATGRGGQYGIRFAGVLLDSALVALGLFLLARYHPRRLPLLGAMVALSPMVLFVAAVVSSSGMETAAAFAAWCGGLCVVQRTEIPRMLAVLTSVSFVVLILSRPVSPYNAAVIIAVSAAFAGLARSRGLIRQRSFRPIWISVLAAMVVAGAYLLVVGTPSLLGSPQKPPLSLLGSVSLTLRLTGGRLVQCIGDFGWSAISAPTWVQVVWTLVLVGLLAYGLVVSRRCRRALPLLVLAIVVMPVIFESPQINSVGTYWEGRYWLPLAMGLALVAASVEPHGMFRRGRAITTDSQRLAGFVSLGALLILAQVAAFLKALHTYLALTVGQSVIKWTPPGGTALVIGLFIFGQIALLALLTRSFLDQDKIARFLETGGRAVRGR